MQGPSQTISQLKRLLAEGAQASMARISRKFLNWNTSLLVSGGAGCPFVGTDFLFTWMVPRLARSKAVVATDRGLHPGPSGK